MLIKDSDLHLSADASTIKQVHKIWVRIQCRHSNAPTLFLENMNNRSEIYVIEMQFEHTLTQKNKQNVLLW